MKDAVVAMKHDEIQGGDTVIVLTDPREISALGTELLEKKPLG
jgi:hypothetical protein